MVGDIRNSIVPSIVTILKYLIHFDPAGGQIGDKRGKTGHLLTNDHENVKMRSNMIVGVRNSMVPSIFNILKYLTHFGLAGGQIGDKTWSNRPSPNK